MEVVISSQINCVTRVLQGRGYPSGSDSFQRGRWLLQWFRFRVGSFVSSQQTGVFETPDMKRALRFLHEASSLYGSQVHQELLEFLFVLNAILSMRSVRANSEAAI